MAANKTTLDLDTSLLYDNPFRHLSFSLSIAEAEKVCDIKRTDNIDNLESQYLSCAARLARNDTYGSYHTYQTILSSLATHTSNLHIENLARPLYRKAFDVMTNAGPLKLMMEGYITAYSNPFNQDNGFNYSGKCLSFFFPFDDYGICYPAPAFKIEPELFIKI